MIFVAIGITALLMVAVFAVLALTDADAEQGPPPTLRPVAPFAHELDSGLGAYADAAYSREWDAHVAEALRLAEPTPVYDRLVCEEIAKREGWA